MPFFGHVITTSIRDDGDARFGTSGTTSDQAAGASSSAAVEMSRLSKVRQIHLTSSMSGILRRP